MKDYSFDAFFGIRTPFLDLDSPGVNYELLVVRTMRSALDLLL